MNPFEAFSAKIIAKRLELDKSRSGRNTQGFGTHPVRPIGPPAAHSTMISAKPRNEFHKNNLTPINNNRPQNNYNNNNNRPQNNYGNNNRYNSNRYNYNNKTNSMQSTIPNLSQNFSCHSPNQYNKKICNFCKYLGHLEEDCRKKKYYYEF
jgi:hypothetical protein